MNVVITTDRSNRVAFKDRLLNKVELSLTPPVEENIDTEPIEIIERYATGLPSILKPVEEFLPEVKRPSSSFILDSDVPKRISTKNRFLHQVEQSLIPVEEVEPVPVEIVERYAHGLPKQGVITPHHLEPEVRHIYPSMPDREIPKRVEIKRALLDRVEHSLTPPVLEQVEPAPIEIIERYAYGIPNQLSDMPEIITELGKSSQFILDSDVPKRIDAKDRLRKKIQSLRVEDPVVKPVEIVGYSQRVVSSVGYDFAPINRPTVFIAPEENPISVPEIVSVENLIPVLRLPSNYEDLDERALYGVLIRNPALQHTSETANLALDVLAGRSIKSVEFEIIGNTVPLERFDPHISEADPVIIPDQFKPQDDEKRVSYASILADKVRSLSESSNDEPDVAPDYHSVLSPPAGWDTVPLSVLRTDLLNVGGTPEQVDMLLSLWTEKPKVEQPQVVASAGEELVDLPEFFTTLSVRDKYIYLTRVLRFTPEKADEVIYG